MFRCKLQRGTLRRPVAQLSNTRKCTSVYKLYSTYSVMSIRRTSMHLNCLFIRFRDSYKLLFKNQYPTRTRLKPCSCFMVMSMRRMHPIDNHEKFKAARKQTHRQPGPATTWRRPPTRSPQAPRAPRAAARRSRRRPRRRCRAAGSTRRTPRRSPRARARRAGTRSAAASRRAGTRARGRAARARGAP